MEALRQPLQLSPGKKWAGRPSPPTCACCSRSASKENCCAASLWAAGSMARIATPRQISGCLVALVTRIRGERQPSWPAVGCGVSVPHPCPICSGGCGLDGRPDQAGPGGLPSGRGRYPTVGSAGWPRTILARPSRSRGLRCCPAWIQPPWAGNHAPGTCRKRRRKRSTATATPARPSGLMAGSLVPGRRSPGRRPHPLLRAGGREPQAGSRDAGGRTEVAGRRHPFHRALSWSHSGELARLSRPELESAPTLAPWRVSGRSPWWWSRCSPGARPTILRQSGHLRQRRVPLCPTPHRRREPSPPAPADLVSRCRWPSLCRPLGPSPMCPWLAPAS